MADPFTGEIRAFGFNFAPQNWAFCDGALFPVQQNPPLFSILGINYGGNGTTNFNLPNLQGRAVIGAMDNQVNNPEGEVSVALAQDEMPAHTHTLKAALNLSKSAAPAGHLLSKFKPNANSYVSYPDSPMPTLTTLAPAAVSSIGGSQAHENRQPYQVMNFCICLYGDWPTRP